MTSDCDLLHEPEICGHPCDFLHLDRVEQVLPGCLRLCFGKQRFQFGGMTATVATELYLVGFRVKVFCQVSVRHDDFVRTQLALVLALKLVKELYLFVYLSFRLVWGCQLLFHRHVHLIIVFFFHGKLVL